MPESLKEIVELFKNVQVVRRWIDGIEYTPDDHPTVVQESEFAVVTMRMTTEEIENKYGLRIRK